MRKVNRALALLIVFIFSIANVFAIVPLRAEAAPVNLALGKVATTSSNEGAFIGQNAVDGDKVTRWSSGFSDNEWIQIDLGASYTISRVVLDWEAAYGKAYRIEISSNASQWNSIYSTTTGDGAIDDLTVSGTGRFIRMLGVQRGLPPYGYSLHEFEVYGPEVVEQVATPAFSPAGGAYTGTQSVTISTSTAGATIRYTVDGSEPTSSSTQYTAPVAIASTTTLKAKAFKQGMTDSQTATAVYTINSASANIALNKIATSSTFEGAGVEAGKAVDGNTATRWSSGFSDNEWIQIDLGATYAINRVVLNWEAAYGKAYRIEVSDNGTSWNSIYSTTTGDGAIDDLTVSGTGRFIRMLGVLRGLPPYGYSLYEFEVYGTQGTAQVATPAFSPAGGIYATAQTVTITTSTAGATIRYTVDGSEPTSASPQYTAPISIAATTTLKAKAFKQGMTDSTVGSAVYTISGAVAAPSFSVGTGTYGSAQNVAISCATEGAQIRYTTNGVDPTEASALYTAPISIQTTTVLKAKAFKTGMTASAVSTATYVIQTGSRGPLQSADWTLVWSDEFNNSTLDKSKWVHDIGNGYWSYEQNQWVAGWGNNELEYYRDVPQNIYTEGGALKIKAAKENPKFTDPSGYQWDYTSAKIKTKGLYAKKYGKIEVKAKLPEGKGLWPAVWMLPKNENYKGWAASGEIDIMEAWGSKPDRVAGTLHYGGTFPDNKSSGKEYVFPNGGRISQYHTYSVEWEPGEMRFYVDGQLYQTQSRWYSENGDYPAPFDREFYIILNLAVGGNFDGSPDASTVFPATMEVDYVRVYELTGKPYLSPVEPAPTVPEARPADARAKLGDGNEVYNSGYNQTVAGQVSIAGVPNTSYWQYLQLPEFGGSGTVALEAIGGRNYAKVNVTNGGTQPYAVQLIQEVPLVKGHYYKASFEAKAGAAKDMQVKLSGGESRGFATYSPVRTIKLSTGMETYDILFKMEAESDIRTRLEFNMGGSTGTVWIGNVRLEEVQPGIL